MSYKILAYNFATTQIQLLKFLIRKIKKYITVIIQFQKKCGVVIVGGLPIGQQLIQRNGNIANISQQFYIYWIKKTLKKIYRKIYIYEKYNNYIMQIYKQKEGIVIQIKKTNRKKGDKTLSMTVYGEDLNIAFGRIQDLYENLAKYEEINIRHKR